MFDNLIKDAVYYTFKAEKTREITLITSSNDLQKLLKETFEERAWKC